MSQAVSTSGSLLSVIVNPGSGSPAECGVTYIESLDLANPAVLRELDSGSYVLYGKFKAYSGDDTIIVFESKLNANIVKSTDCSSIMIFNPVNSKVECLTIYDDRYERTDIALQDVAAHIGQLKNELDDFKSLADVADSNDDNKDTLYVVDGNGKIIATISKDGIDTVGYKKHGEDFTPGSLDILETYDDVFYIADGNGNVIFKASKNGIEGVNISGSSSSPYKDKVLISIGDSLSAHDKWQKWLVEWWGCKFDADKNINGDGDYPPMAKGGTAVMPNSTDSIYIRALSASHYNPDVIILYAGQNDVPYFGSATEVNQTAVGTINDVPYKKTVPYTELEESEYADYTAWYQGRPTLYSYCMGLVENLLVSCPKAQIVVLTPMQMWSSDGVQSVGRKQMVAVWHDICSKYALPVVDLWNESGVNAFNMTEYYPNAANVHPNDYGYKRIAEAIYRKM